MAILKWSRRKLGLVHHNSLTARPCNCDTWRHIEREHRDHVLARLMEWAWLFYKVQLKMLVRGDHVAVCELVTLKPGEGRVRRVMEEICLWADCGDITLELSPSEHWGADVDRLTRFYFSLEFQYNHEPRNPFVVQEDLIRYPQPDRGHRAMR